MSTKIPEPQKEIIADAFLRHFSHFGFQKTSMDQVAHELKISKKTIYQYFDTKEKIFYFVVHRIAQEYCRKMEVELEKSPTAREKLSRLLRMIFSESKKWLRTGDAFEFRYKQEIGELAFRDAYGDLLKRLLQSGMEHGEFPRRDVDITLRFIQGILGEAMKALTMNPKRSVDDQAEKAILRVLG
jgi:TetR/AcrR family transcriptional repressor of mexJK operon